MSPLYGSCLSSTGMSIVSASSGIVTTSSTPPYTTWTYGNFVVPPSALSGILFTPNYKSEKQMLEEENQSLHKRAKDIKEEIECLRKIIG